MRKQLFWNSLGNLAYLGAQWLLTLLVTRLNGYESAGLFSLAMSVSAVFQSVALAGMRNYQVSDIHSEFSDSCYVTARLMTCTASLLMCLLFIFLNGYPLKHILAVIGMMVFRLGECSADVFHGIEQKAGRLDLAGKSFLIRSVCLFAGYGLCGFGTGNVMSGIWGMALASLLVTVLFDRHYAESLANRSETNFEAVRLLLMTTLPLCLYQVLSAAIVSLPKYFLERVMDETALGIYSAVFTPVMLIQAVSGYLSQPYAPEFARMWDAGDIKGFRRLTGIISGAVTALALLAIPGVPLGKPILILLFGDSIASYVYLLPPAIVCSSLVSLFSFLGMLMVILRDFRGLTAACLTGCLICCLAAPAAIQKMGMNGANLGLILSLAAALLILTVRLLSALKRGTSSCRKKF